MNVRTWNRLRLAALAGLLGACGDGLATTLKVATGDGGISPDADSPPTLGTYGRPCDVIENSQPAYASFSPTGDMVALSVDGPGHVEIHATSDGHLVTGFDAHFGQVTAMAYSPKDSLLASAGIDGAVKLWRDGVLVAQQQVFPRPVATLTWSHDGKSLALVGAAGPLALLRVNGDVLALGWTVDGQFGGSLPFFSPDGTFLTAKDGTTSLLRIFNVADGAQGQGVDGQQPPYVLAQSPDGSMIAYTDNFVQHVTIARLTWQGEQSTIELLWQRGFPSSKGAVEFTADSKNLAIWGDNAQVSLYDVENGNVVGTLSWTSSATSSITFSPDSRWALVLDYAYSGGAARLVDLGSGNSVAIATQPGMSEWLVPPVSVSADGTLMATPTWPSSAPSDAAVVIWNLSTRQRIAKLPWSYSYPTSLPELSAQGDLVYGPEDIYPAGKNSGAYTIGLRIESLVDPALSAHLTEDSSALAVALTNDGRTLAIVYSTYQDQPEWRIRLLDRSSNFTKADFSIGARSTASLFFSPDGTQIAILHSQWSGGDPGTDFSVWRASDGQMLFEAGHHTYAPRSMAFSPDGSMLVLIGNGGTDFAGIEVYDARGWRWLRTLGRSSQQRNSVHFSPDGKYLVVSEADGILVFRTSDWQRYETFGSLVSEDAVFLPQNQGVLEIATGILWCSI